MNRVFLIFFLVFICYAHLQAQDSTLRAREMEQEILKTQNTDLEILAKGRNLILTCINQDSLQKAIAVQKYLDERFQGTRVMPFWRDERELLAFWTKQYSYLLNTDNIEPQTDDGFRQKIVPPRDLMLQELQQKAVQEKSKLIAGIVSSNLTDDEKQFLRLELATWIVNRTDPKHAQDSLNSLANTYVDEYPRSSFTLFVRKYIRHVYRPSEWGFGMDISLGAGYLQGDLSNYFDNYVPLAFGFETSYRQYLLYLRAAIGVGSTAKKAFSHFGVWNQGLALNVTIPELSVGYMLVENETLRIAPYLGLGGILIETTEQETKRTGNDVHLYSDASFLYGMNFDLRVGSMTIPLFNTQEISNWVLKVRFTVVPSTFSGTNKSFSGSTYFLTFGIGGIGHSIQRDE